MSILGSRDPVRCSMEITEFSDLPFKLKKETTSSLALESPKIMPFPRFVFYLKTGFWPPAVEQLASFGPHLSLFCSCIVTFSVWLGAIQNV